MSTSTEVSQGQRPIQRHIGPSILIGLGLVILLGAAGWLAIERLVIGQGNLTLPATLAGVPRSDQVIGRAALAEIKRLHGKGFPLTDGAMARYGEDTATLWVSSTWAPFLAARQVEAMTDRISEGRSPFTPTGTHEVGSTTVYVLTGMGQVHYYFQLDRRVVWLAISPPLAEQGLEELMRAWH